MNQHLRTAYALGARAAMTEFEKIAAPIPGTRTPPASQPVRPPVQRPVAPATPAKPAAPVAPAQPQMTVQQYGPGTKQYQQAQRLARTTPPPPPAGQAERQAYNSRYDAIRAMQAEQEAGGMSAARAKYWGNIMKGF